VFRDNPRSSHGGWSMDGGSVLHTEASVGVLGNVSVMSVYEVSSRLRLINDALYHRKRWSLVALGRWVSTPASKSPQQARLTLP
jgi:hypothetical protein